MTAHVFARRVALLAFAAVLASSALAQSGVNHISTNGPTNGSGLPGPFNNTNISTVIGAQRFYNAGYRGSRAIAANIEAGHAWNAHQDLTGRITQTFTAGGALGAFDFHATWAMHAMGGNGGGAGDYYRQGVANQATLWSSAIATAWNSGLGFNFSAASYDAGYRNPLITGVNGVRADVANSSWGNSGNRTPDGYFSQALDNIIGQARRLVTFSSGNEGATTGASAPAAGFNGMSVGATTGQSNPNAFTTMAGFSNGGYGNINNPNTNTVLTGIRATVDIVAPGTNFVLAEYNGNTGGGAFDNTTVNPGAAPTNTYTANVSGTSFAAPTVAGGAALMVDAAKDLGLTNALDNTVMKAILMNSATKLAGWNNQTTNVGGVLTTAFGVDARQGAGALNLDAGYDQLLSGTRDVAGNGGGSVLNLGWDLGEVSFGGANDYALALPVVTGSAFTATLVWNVDTRYTINTSTNYDRLANLNLEVWQVVNGTFTTLVAQSNGRWNNEEHLSFNVTGANQLGIRVRYLDDTWSFANNTSAVRFGLAWNSSPVPEPMTLGILALGALAARRKRRNKS